ncbi:MAG: tetratricopeptide repeat protein [Candidatus Pacearchaeota archaeon]|jgi:tetratricopeptide (TPR) repeat protein
MDDRYVSPLERISIGFGEAFKFTNTLKVSLGAGAFFGVALDIVNYAVKSGFVESEFSNKNVSYGDAFFKGLIFGVAVGAAGQFLDNFTYGFKDAAKIKYWEDNREILNQGNDLYRCGEYSEALKKYNQVLSYDSDISEAYFNRSLANFCLEDYEAALKDIEKYDKHNKGREEDDFKVSCFRTKIEQAVCVHRTFKEELELNRIKTKQIQQTRRIETKPIQTLKQTERKPSRTERNISEDYSQSHERDLNPHHDSNDGGETYDFSDSNGSDGSTDDSGGDDSSSDSAGDDGDE